MNQSLYERIGGEKTVSAAVGVFYEKVLADDRVNHFFTNMDMAHQRHMQKHFLTFAFGGLNTYTGRGLMGVHKKLQLSEEHFQAISEALKNTLIELDIQEDLISEVLDIIRQVHDDVVYIWEGELVIVRESYASSIPFISGLTCNYNYQEYIL